MPMSLASTPERGFTLLEVMIVVVIVGILAAIALPSYSDYVLRSKIIDGTAALGDFRTQMEKYFLDNRTYQDAGGNCGIANKTVENFTITCNAGTATTYTVTATGIAAKGMSSSFVYTVDQSNTKNSTGPTGWGKGVGCWAVRKDGSCS